MMSGLPSSSSDQSADINASMHTFQDRDQIINKLIQAKLIEDTDSARHIPSESTSYQAQEIEMSNSPVMVNQSGKKYIIIDHNNSPNDYFVNPFLIRQTDRRHLATEIHPEATTDTDKDIPQDFNSFKNKKVMSHGMINAALLSANTNQLRFVLGSNDESAVYIVCTILLIVSILLQVSVGLAELLSTRYDVNNTGERKIAFKLGNYISVGSFFITIINVIVTSVGGETSKHSKPPSADDIIEDAIDIVVG